MWQARNPSFTSRRMLPEPSDLQTENTKTNTKTNNNHKLLKTCKT